MSYPSNSSFIDLRSRIRTPVSKTKLILQELEQLSSGKNTKKPIHELQNSRWISSSGDSNLPPRRSSFTPSRIQEISANLNKNTLRNRADALPYWRRSFNSKPQPVEEDDVPMNGDDSSAPTVPPTSSVNDEPSTYSARHTPILKSVNRRTIVSNDKPNVFSLKEPEEHENLDTSALEKIVPLPALGQKLTAGFLKQTAEEESAVFQFDPPEVRGPRPISVERPTKKTLQETPKPNSDSESVISEVGSDSESDNSVVPQKETTQPPPSEPKTVEVSTSANTAPATASTPAPSAGQKWTCSECWVPNDDYKDNCACCGTAKPGTQAESNEDAAPPAPKQTFKPTNFAAISVAPSPFQFGFGAPIVSAPLPVIPKPTEVLQSNGAANGKFPQLPSVAATPVPSFNFSGAPTTTTLAPFKFASETTTDAPSAPFQFGLAAPPTTQPPQFQFGGPMAPAPAALPFQMSAAPGPVSGGGAMGRRKLLTARRKHL